MAVILLADNGSVKADASLQLRLLASSLSELVEQHVHPVSFQHANRIAIEKLNNQPAQIFYHFMREQLSKGERDFILLPLFFGMSKTLTSFLPEKLDLLKKEFGLFEFKVADTIYPLPSGDNTLTRIMIDHINITASQSNLPLTNIVIVDHGSPVPAVTAVRKHLTLAVEKSLNACVKFEQAVMERREGKEYDFNGELLENWLTTKAQAGEQSAIVVLLFFLPGRHAGKGGDISEICQAVMDNFPNFKVAISPLICEHSLLLTILESRLQAAIAT